MKKAIILIGLSLAACGCGGKSIDNPKSSAAIDSATAHGRRDAAVFADSCATAMQREAAIFTIKHKEAHMRAMGYNKAADAYIRAAIELIPDSITTLQAPCAN